jgi:hypothetical protein
MKKMLIALAIVSLTLAGAAPASAGPKRIVHRGPQGRSTVVVHRAHPIRRAFPNVRVRAPRVAPRVAGVVFLPLVIFRTVTAARPTPAVLCWEDSDWISRQDDWTDLTLNADAAGHRIFLEVAAGKIQLEFAEVVFENGEVQVVDFDRSTLREGIYPLLDFRAGRRVDHVRLVARARSDRARVVLMLER